MILSFYKKRKTTVFPLLFDSPYFSLYSYPLCMGLAWGFGYFYTQYIFEKYEKDPSPLIYLFLGIFITSFAGAKLFFLWFSSGAKFYQYLYANYFWMGGGFVFYGGLIFGLIFYFLYSHVFKKFDLKNSALLLPGLILGHAIGRIGCFLAGCCYGTRSHVAWAVEFNGELRHPVQMYEALALFFLGTIILLQLKYKKSNSIIVSTYLISYSMIRFILEFFRGDDIRGILVGVLSSSQFISIGIFLLGIITFFLLRKGETQQSLLTTP